MRQQVEGQKSSVALSVLVAALGYFVDIYDLILFSIVRLASLADLGIPKEPACCWAAFCGACWATSADEFRFYTARF
jgi:hypothetical protein